MSSISSSNNVQMPIDPIRVRVQKTSQAFDAINDARRLLNELELLAAARGNNKTIDLVKTAGLTHDLREDVDKILVGLVESSVGLQEAA